MKKILYSTIILALAVSCTLDTAPRDALSSATFPKTESDIEMMAIGCYDGYTDQNYTVYNDVFSDNGICTINANFARYANGKTSHDTPGTNWYSYSTITRCNNFLSVTNDTDIKFKDPGRLTQLRNEVRFLRAFKYYTLCTAFGDVPLIKDVVPSLEAAKVPVTSEEDIVEFILQELSDITEKGQLAERAAEDGRVTRGAALALMMRTCLHYKMYQEAIDAADEIINSRVYSLVNDRSGGKVPYEEVFKEKNEGNSEIILAFKRCMNDYKNQTIIEFCNVNDGGWSAFVPIQDLVDAYEMSNGLTIEEAKASGQYDPVHPFKDRDPRFYSTILFPGADWANIQGVERIYNTLDIKINGEDNKDHIAHSNNSSKTGYSLRKYMNPLSQYTDANNTGLDLILFRYAEVLLAKAEALIELNQELSVATDLIDEVRTRAGMPATDRTKYNDQAKLRELLRRERRVEFAFEGLRRTDLMRWGLTLKKLNGPVYGCNLGTVHMDKSIPQTERAELYIGDNYLNLIENRSAKNVYMPIPQSEIDVNPEIKQTNFQ
ncbi:MAG: RagB/SusD family nutrient uptake outer membrane protein [Bacteroidales bacterium]|nr:RagB/SusD family nutrient uptake outer membrane protein [Bacteroidales bacterium]